MLKNQRAFTLVELLVTLTVLSVVVAWAIPSFNGMLQNSRSIALGEDFATAINLARSEAVKRAQRVSICASSDGINCTANWTDGFIVFVDFAITDVAAAPVLAGPNGAVILKTWPRQNNQAQITVQRNGGNVNFFRFTGLGTLARITNDAVVINTRTLTCTSTSARQITVGLSGMVRVDRVNCQ